jgi:acetylornithine deacetylase
VMRTVAEILMDLVAIPSVSSMSNQPVIDYVLRYLDASHWAVELHNYRDSSGTPKANLVAMSKAAAGTATELAFVCHTDTVPFEPAWRAAVHPVIQDGRLYGRGSCDVKGFLACVLETLSSPLDLARLQKPLALVLTADEEVGCVGAKHLAAKSAVRSRFMIIGEPTGLRPVRAGKGYALAEITVRGKEAHSAFPADGHSAILDAARVVLQLEHVAAKLAQFTDPTFDPPFTTMNVGLIHGGTAKNIVPGECRVTVEWRPIPGQSPALAAELIEEQLSQLAAAHPGFEARLDVKRMDPPFEPTPTSDLASLVESVSGRPPTTVSFGSEAAHFRQATSETIVFGPGDMTVAHKSGEFVPVAELTECVAHLRAVVATLCF